MIEISVIIPTYNRAEQLKSCLDALARQTQTPDSFEVVVVIDGSTDHTVEMLKNYAAPYPLRSIWQENGGQPSALNHGIQEAIGELCLLLDDDIIAEQQLIAEHLRTHSQHRSAVVIGQIQISLQKHGDWYANAFARGWNDHYEQLNNASKSLTWEDSYSGNLSASRDALLASGGFALNLTRGYDVELARRLQEHGCVLVYASHALGCQTEQKGFKELSRDAENAGKADVLSYKQNSFMLSEALGSFAQGSWRKLLVHRFLLSFHIPLAVLNMVGKMIKNPARQYSFYSLIQKYCYWRGVRQVAGATELWEQLTSGVCILMYHAIGMPSEAASSYILPVHQFEKHLAWIKKLGYQPISLQQFLEHKRNCALPPARSVVITFDDGYTDNYSLAYPILQRHDMPATIFVVSGYVGRANEWDQRGDLAGRPLMSWEQLQELKAWGIQIGAHSRTHPKLTKVSENEALEEIAGSQKDLHGKLGSGIDIIAYPYGEYNEVIQHMARQADFVAGCTADAQLNTLIGSSYTLKRTEIRGNESIARFLLALWTGNAEALGWTRKQPSDVSHSSAMVHNE